MAPNTGGYWEYRYKDNPAPGEESLEVTVEVLNNHSILTEPNQSTRLIDSIGKKMSDKNMRTEESGKRHSLDSALRLSSNPHRRKCRIFGEFWVQSDKNIDERDDANTQDFQIHTSKLFNRFISFRLFKQYVESLKSDFEQKRVNFQNPDRFKGVLLFADVSQFSQLTRSYVREFDFSRNNTRSFAAESLWNHLNHRVFRRLTKIVTDHGGDVLKFVGDGIMVAFDEKYFDSPKQTVSTALRVALDIMKIDRSKLHCGLGYGEVSCFLVGGVNNRVEYFLSGPPLQQAIDMEKESSKVYKENEKKFKNEQYRSTLLPIAVSKEAMEILKPPKEKLKKYFERKNDFYIVQKSKSAQNKSIKQYFGDIGTENDHTKWLEMLNGNPIKENIDKEKDELSIEQLHILKTIIRLHGPKTVQQYVRLSGNEKWSPELRVCTSMFLKLDGIADTGDEIKDGHQNEDLVLTIQAAIEEVQTAVARFGGVFLRFVVDDKGAVMFVAFGLPPRIYDEDSIRAATCALEIHERITYLRERLLQRGSTLGNKLGISIGITSGKVFAGTVGGETRCEYTIHGESVNVANNLMAQASDRKDPKDFRVNILVGKEVKEQSEHALKYNERPEFVRSHIRDEKKPKGSVDRNNQMKAYKMVGKKIRNTRKQYLNGGPTQQFDKRNDYLERREKDKLLVIEGDSGMGKSFTAQMLARTAYERKKVVAVVKGSWFDKQNRYHVLMNILLQLLLDGNDWPENDLAAQEELKRGLGDYYDSIGEHLFPSTVFKSDDFDNAGKKTQEDLLSCLATVVQRHKGKNVFICIDDWHLVHQDAQDVIWKYWLDRHEVQSLRLVLTCNNNSNSPACIYANQNGFRYELAKLDLEESESMIERITTLQVPKYCIEYFMEMGSGVPRYVLDLVEIMKDLGWFKNDVISAEAWGMIHDNQLTYTDSVTRQLGENEVKVVEKPGRQTIKTVVSFFPTDADGLDSSQDLKIKIDDYFDSKMYPTASILSAFVDRFSPMQHMTLKVAANLGMDFNVELLVKVLKNLNDNVYLENDNENDSKVMNVVDGSEQLVYRFVEETLQTLEQGGVLEQVDAQVDGDKKEFRFKLRIMRETISQMMPHHLRVYVNGAAVKAINGMPGEYKRKKGIHISMMIAHHAYEFSKFLLHRLYQFNKYIEIFTLGYACMKELENNCHWNGYAEHLYFTLARLTEWDTRFLNFSQVELEGRTDNAAEFREWYSNNVSPLERVVTLRRMAEYLKFHAKHDPKIDIYLSRACEYLETKKNERQYRYNLDVEIEWFDCNVMMLEHHQDFQERQEEKKTVNKAKLPVSKLKGIPAWTKLLKSIQKDAFNCIKKKSASEENKVRFLSCWARMEARLKRGKKQYAKCKKELEDMHTFVVKYLGEGEVLQDSRPDIKPYVIHMFSKTLRFLTEFYKLAIGEKAPKKQQYKFILKNERSVNKYCEMWIKDAYYEDGLNSFRRKVWVGEKIKLLRVLCSAETIPVNVVEELYTALLAGRNETDFREEQDKYTQSDVTRIEVYINGTS